MTKPSFDVDQAALQIDRDGHAWSLQNGQDLSITYAYRATDADYDFRPSPGTFAQFNMSQILGAQMALTAWADVANIDFVRVGRGNTGPSAYSDNATILFGNYSKYYQDFQTGVKGGTFSPDPAPGDRSPDSYQGDVWINAYWYGTANPTLGGYGQFTLVHEIGHALGLQHPGNYTRSNGTPVYGRDAEYVEDTQQYSVMSYFSEAYTGAAFYDFMPSAPMLHDIAAVQRLYGANMSVRGGDTTYGFGSNAKRPWFEAQDANSRLVFCVWDPGGTDTFDFSGFWNDQLVDLRAAHFSNVGALIGNVSIAANVLIENAIGGEGADMIIGNDSGNSLSGRGGDDVLEGGLGKDRLSGGAGFDTASYLGAAAGVTVNLSKTGAQKTGITGSDYLQSIEGLTGSAFADTLTGNDLANAFTAGDGDTVNGRGGQDVLHLDLSGYEQDIEADLSALTEGRWLRLGSANLVEVETGEVRLGSGDDRVSLGSAIFTLDGGGGNDWLTGDAADDVLAGGFGKDILDGREGADTASYAAAHTGVDVSLAHADFQTTGMGPDKLISIENLLGSRFDDRLSGNGAANTISGGLGDDTLAGGAGDDRLFGSSNSGDNFGDSEILLGEDGSDYLYLFDSTGSQLVDGGTGDDDITCFSYYAMEMTVVGGAGNDRILVGYGEGAIFAGPGNDRVTRNYAGDVTISLGLGSDVFEPGYGSWAEDRPEAITDFKTGDSGDRLDLYSMLFYYHVLEGWNSSINPFSAGYFDLVQSGPDAVLRIDVDGGADDLVDFIRFQNSTAKKFTAFNLGGYSSDAAPAADVEFTPADEYAT